MPLTEEQINTLMIDGAFNREYITALDRNGISYDAIKHVQNIIQDKIKKALNADSDPNEPVKVDLRRINDHVYNKLFEPLDRARSMGNRLTPEQVNQVLMQYDGAELDIGNDRFIDRFRETNGVGGKPNRRRRKSNRRKTNRRKSKTNRRSKRSRMSRRR